MVPGTRFFAFPSPLRPLTVHCHVHFAGTTPNVSPGEYLVERGRTVIRRILNEGLAVLY